MEEGRFIVQTKSRHFIPFNHEEQEIWKDPFYFIQAADTQFGMEETYMLKLKNPGWTKEIEWSKQMIQDITSMTPKPKFLVVCGDLLDAFPESMQEMRMLQEIDFKKVFAMLDIPLVCICGNHDVGNQPTYETVSSYTNSFGDDYFSFWCGGVFFIALNSQFYEDSSKVKDLATEQEIWLEKQFDIIKQKKPKHAVVFQHIPLFLKDPDEEKCYFNFEITLRKQLLEKLYKSGVRYIFCGHFHRNAGGNYKDLEEIVTSAVGSQLGNDDHGYRIVRIYEDSLQHRYCSLGKAPKKIL